MRIAITGATGNIGTSLLEVLARDERVEEIVGIARRPCPLVRERTRFVRADVGQDVLEEALRGMDAVVHLAWQVQPARDREQLERTNVEGSKRVFSAAARAGVKTLIHASSAAVYSRGSKDRFVDESWPRAGISSSTYSRQKAQVEALLDAFEAGHPNMRIVRLRPVPVFKREAATGVRRLYLGPVLPRWLFRPHSVPLVPDHELLCFQCVHSLDVARAFQSALFGDARGAFNLAAEPVIDSRRLALLLHTRKRKMSERVLRALTTATFRLHLQRTDAGWVDLALKSPLVDAARAREELPWRPRYAASEALAELFDGLREGAAMATPPLGRGPYGRLSVGLAAR